MKTPANIAAANRLARRREERLRKEAEVAARHAAAEQVRKDRVAYREAKASGTLPPVTPPTEVGDVGGYDLNGNPL